MRPIPSFAFALVLLTSTAALAVDDECPPVDPFRTAQETFDARNQALAQGDLAGAMCAYAKHAKVIMPGSIIEGRDNIAASFASFGALFGGAMPTITTQTSTHSSLLITYTLTGPTLSIPDGADTFVVLFGRIVLQTVHATVVPTSP